MGIDYLLVDECKARSCEKARGTWHAVVDLSFIYLNQIRVCGLWSESIFNELGIDGLDVTIPFDTTGTLPGFRGLRHGST